MTTKMHVACQKEDRIEKPASTRVANYVLQPAKAHFWPGEKFWAWAVQDPVLNEIDALVIPGSSSFLQLPHLAAR